MTTQRGFEPHEFIGYADASHICRHCDRGEYAAIHKQPRPTKAQDTMTSIERALTPQAAARLADADSDAEHDDDDIPAPRAGERNEWEYRETRYGAEARAGQFVIRLHWTGLADIGDTRATIRKIVTDHNQHATLVEQRDRLLEAIRDVAIRSLLYCEQKYDHDDQARLNLEALLTTIEQSVQNAGEGDQGRKSR